MFMPVCASRFLQCIFAVPFAVLFVVPSRCLFVVPFAMSFTVACCACLLRWPVARAFVVCQADYVLFKLMQMQVSTCLPTPNKYNLRSPLSIWVPCR